DFFLFSSRRRKTRFSRDWSSDVCSSDLKFVFVGAGGGALPLLQKSGIDEIKGFGGFPVSGQFLRCTDETIINQHHAKVYGQASRSEERRVGKEWSATWVQKSSRKERAQQ